MSDARRYATLDDAIEANQRRSKYQYPRALPLPKYQAWELLCGAINRMQTHMDSKPYGKYTDDSGDFDALCLLIDARVELVKGGK